MTQGPIVTLAPEVVNLLDAADRLDALAEHMAIVQGMRRAADLRQFAQELRDYVRQQAQAHIPPDQIA